METDQRTSNLPDPAPVGILDSSLGGVRKQVLVEWLFTSTCNSSSVRAFIATYNSRSNLVWSLYSVDTLRLYRGSSLSMYVLSLRISIFL